MEEMKQKTLEDLVPPLELCKAAREVIGERTALVWWYIGNEWVVADRKLSVNDNAKYIIPAPTLAELLEMLPVDFQFYVTDEEFWEDGAREYGIYVDSESESDPEFSTNPATAALRLLMKVKGVDV